MAAKQGGRRVKLGHSWEADGLRPKWEEGERKEEQWDGPDRKKQNGQAKMGFDPRGLGDF